MEFSNNQERERVCKRIFSTIEDIARKINNPIISVEDFVQQALCDVWMHISQYNPSICSIETFTSIIAKKLYAKILRRRYG